MSLSVRNASLLIAVTALTALALAFLSEYGFGLFPCVLCIWQRWSHFAAALLALVAVSGRLAPSLFLGAASLAELVTAGIAAFHVGVEQKWWEGTSECGSSSDATSLEALKAQIMAAPVVRCDEVAFEFLGISMAGWNMLLALGLALVGALALCRAVKGDK